MFKFQRILSGGGNWTDNLFKEDERLGTLGLDKYGLFLNINRDLTMQEFNLLFAQLLASDPTLATHKIEIHKEK